MTTNPASSPSATYRPLQAKMPREARRALGQSPQQTNQAVLSTEKLDYYDYRNDCSNDCPPRKSAEKLAVVVSATC